MNEAGLVANVLWLVESQYPDVKKSNKPLLSIAAWAQYVLDNFATVDEAVKALEKEPYTIVTDSVPGETRLTTLHLSISDKTVIAQLLNTLVASKLFTTAEVIKS